MTSPFPEPESSALAPYVVRSRVEIVSALRQLRDQHVLVNLFHGSEGRFTVGTVLDVHAGADEVILDCAADAAGAEIAAARLVLVGFLDNVKLQFAIESAEPLVAKGPVFRLRLPRQMLRLQRRAFLRVKARAAVCYVPRTPGSMYYHALRVFDLGLGGCSMQVPAEGLELKAGQQIERCQLELPGATRLDVVLRVRYLDPTPERDSGPRIGCEFLGLDATSQRLLQQYLDQMGLVSPTTPVNRTQD
jgi:c-di-GMP-binding flagellar brake protein YcgR